MKLKTILTVLYLLTSTVAFLFFKAEPMVWTSVFLNFLAVTAITYYHLNIEKIFSPFLTTYIIFVYLFFVVAPIVQITTITINPTSFPNSFPYRTANILFANAAIFLFNVVFFLSYVYFKKKRTPIITNDVLINSYNTPVVLLVFLVIALLIVTLNIQSVLNDLNSTVYEKLKEPLSVILIRKKTIFLIPLAALAITLQYLKTKKVITVNTLVAAFSILILVGVIFFLKNPLTEKRNALGPLYITLIYLFYPRTINSNQKFFLFMFLSMVIAFPILSSLTHIKAGLNEIIANPDVVIDSYALFGDFSRAFNSLHYDAYPNFLATIEYVEKQGFSLGVGLLGALLFFVPRSIWPSKPISTGAQVGDYLIAQYDFGDGIFNNLSNPLVSEAYFNFGIIGVVLFPIILAALIIKFYSWFFNKDILKQVISFYFAVHLIFFLRGDLVNGVAYFIGPFVGIYIIPKLVIKLFKKW